MQEESKKDVLPRISRIRYVERSRNKNELISTQEVQSSYTGARYRVVINPTEMYYKIINVRDMSITRKGGESLTHVHSLKRAVKRELRKLGVKFNIEVKDRTALLERKNNRLKEANRLRYLKAKEAANA